MYVEGESNSCLPVVHECQNHSAHRVKHDKRNLKKKKSSPEDESIDFREREREREKQRNIDVREKHGSVTSGTRPSWGMELATQVCDLTRNQTHKLLVHGMTCLTTEPPCQGKELLFYHYLPFIPAHMTTLPLRVLLTSWHWSCMPLPGGAGCHLNLTVHLHSFPDFPPALVSPGI